MDGFQDHSAGGDGGTRGSEVELQVPAVDTLEGGGDVPCDGNAATFAEGRFNEADLAPALPADKPFIGCRPLVATKLADFRIEQRETRLETAGKRCSGHGWTIGIESRRAKPEVKSQFIGGRLGAAK